MERSSRVLSGTLEATSSLPPRCSRNVRSLTLRTRTPGTSRSACTISSEWAASAAEQVTSTVRPSGRLSTTSMAVTAPPADPTAVAMRPMLAGAPSAVRRTGRGEEGEVTRPRGGGPGGGGAGVGGGRGGGGGGGRGAGPAGGGRGLARGGDVSSGGLDAHGAPHGLTAGPARPLAGSRGREVSGKSPASTRADGS